MQAMVQDHRQDVATFERESNRANDPALRQWAAKTLPTLKSHLEQAESTWNKVKG
jgi:putative membrane protein